MIVDWIPTNRKPRVMATQKTDLERLRELTLKLYDGETPESDRRELSLEVSVLRQKVFGSKADLEQMIEASKEDEES